MSLLSLDFFILAGVTVILYGAIPYKIRWIVLLASSILFYLPLGIRALATMVFMSGIVFCAGIIIESKPDKSRKRMLVMILGVMTIACWLILLKLSTAGGWGSFLVIPLGVSYISFSLIGYLIDVYWGNEAAERNYFRFLLFAFYFPKISQGPIVKRRNIASLLYGGQRITYTNTCFGLQRMVYGYFKKLVIADRAALYTTPILANISAYSGSMIIIAVALAALQLYCDFSGYMDIIMGYSQILGIKMEENFNHPFFSTSAAEFWRRWHITLGEWFKDYVYTPLVMAPQVKKIGKWGRKKIGKRFGNSIMKVIALSVVWLLTGFWHGTGINYILWGIYWGTIIIMSAMCEKEMNAIVSFLHIKTDTISWKVFRMFRTFAIFWGGILLTNVNSLQDIKIAVYKVIYEIRIWDVFNGSLYLAGLDKLNFQILSFSLLTVWMISIAQERVHIREAIAGLNAPVRWFLYAVSISIVLLLGIYGEGYSTAGFAYTNF